MTETFFKSVPLTAEEAAARGYARIRVDLGEPTLAFSTYARKSSLVLRRAGLDTITPAGVGTLASIYVPEARKDFSTSVDAFVFDHAIEAQPCADYALISRGYAPVPESGQHGLLIGGSVGIFYENGEKVRGARSHAVVRGNVVLVVVMDFPIAGSDAFLEESGVFVANLQFDAADATRFRPKDLETLALPLPGTPLPLVYPANWAVTLDSFPTEKPAGTVLFAVGDANDPAGLMTFGFRQDTSAAALDAAAMDAWATRIATQYQLQNPTTFGQPKLQSKGKLTQLKDSAAVDAFYIFHLDNLKLQRQTQVRVVVVANGNDRYTLSMLTDVSHFETFTRFLVYAAGITAHDMMVDSLLHRLVGRGF